MYVNGFISNENNAASVIYLKSMFGFIGKYPKNLVISALFNITEYHQQIMLHIIGIGQQTNDFLNRVHFKKALCSQKKFANFFLVSIKFK